MKAICEANLANINPAKPQQQLLKVHFFILFLKVVSNFDASSFSGMNETQRFTTKVGTLYIYSLKNNCHFEGH